MAVLEADAPVRTNRHEKFHALIARAQVHAPVKVAVAHPCDRLSLESVLEAARQKLMVPILVCSFVFMVVVFERIISLRRGRVLPRPFVSVPYRRRMPGVGQRGRELVRAETPRAGHVF